MNTDVFTGLRRQVALNPSKTYDPVSLTNTTQAKKDNDKHEPTN